VAHCLSLRLPRGTAIVDPSTTSVIAWIKCGPYVTIDEARTQDWTAKALHDADVSDIQVPRVFHAFTAKYYGGSIGYIAMEYIEGADRPPTTADRDTRTHWRRYKIYCTLLLS